MAFFECGEVRLLLSLPEKDEFAQLQAELEASGFYQIGTKIEDAAQGLGLAEIGLDQDVTALSGGQRTKLLLAKLLLEEPDVLLLDEPKTCIRERKRISRSRR